ncbi:hypothetical protein RGQ15_06350 [Paracoccus sp. MBLB3053]|uniref:Uncharacterized protein n=1 Tax=Paracoccus aurantius TaxID=3073814 RepID=A0ABU2HR02_9RHOB|nr:hypothetical protein [Paracoccus sp. MBLB3053]MDS9467192.1 hypothetical protein [Paracoccus sp. MBLB3053]
MDRNAIINDTPVGPGKGHGGFMRDGHRLALPLAGMLLLSLNSGCSRAPTDLVLPGGIPAKTNLHEASGLPSQAVRTVNRNDAGWRLIYHPGRAPAGAEQQAARALCGLERRRVAQIVRLPLDAPFDDPGASKIDIICA